MTYTDAPPAPKPCWHGSKCSNKKCKFAHPPPPEAGTSSNAENGHAAAGGRDQAVMHHVQPPANKPKGKQAGKKANRGDKQPANEVKQGQENTPKQTSATNKAASLPPKPSTKLCKYGVDCRRTTCPYQHPATEEVTSISPCNNDAKTEVVKKNARKKSESRTSTQKSETGSVTNTTDQRAEEPARKTKTKQHKPKAKKPCRAGANCRNAKCTFLHPHDESTAPIHSAAAKSSNIAMTVAAVLEQSREELAIKNNMQQAMWDGGLQVSTVAEAIKSTPELKKKEATRAHQQKRHQEEEEAERLRLEKEEAELHFLLQAQEHQRLAEAEAEHRLQEQKAEEERKKKERIRRQKEKEEQCKRATKRIEQEAKHLAEEERKRQERLRQEQEEMERCKRAFEAMREEAEAAKSQAEKERTKQEEELLYFAKLKAEKERLLKEEEEERLRFEEEEKRYKEERKAAKKERKRREQEARAELQREAGEEVLKGSPTNSNRDVLSPTNSNRDMQSPTNSNRENVNNFNTFFDCAPDARAEEEVRKLRVQEELRLQKERTTEKKERKQKLRRERFLEDLERQTQERTQFWQKEIAAEKRAVEILMQLCVAEFCRKNPGVDRQAVLSDPDAKARIEEVAQQTYRIIYKTDSHSRFAVKGMKQQDLNDRTGTIERWDENKGKFYVALDTKKGKNPQSMYFAPGNLEVLPNDSVRKSKKKGDPVHMVFIALLYDGKELMTDIYKSDVDALKESSCLDDYLASLMKERDTDERLAKEQEEEELRQEEEARRRRAEQRRQEAEEWEERKREYEAQKAQYQEWRREERRQRKSSRTHGVRGSGCNCPQCQFERIFLGDMRGGMGGFPGFFFSFGGGPGTSGRGFSFGADYDDEDYDYEDEWDRQWNRKHEEEEAAKNEEFADVLGVEIDATAAEIKRVYRKKALKYHPDKYRAENHEDGMTKDKAEEHFKELTNAYDHLMSNFDD